MIGRIAIANGDVILSAFTTGNPNSPAVLLSNSLGAGLEMWAPQREMLERTYRVIGYDTRGHGQSSTPAGPYDFDDLTGDALAILDHLEIETADFIGLSLGGMTGLGLGLNHADRFGKIVCACARADAPPPFAQIWDTRIAAIEADGMAAIWPGTLERWLTSHFIAENPETVAQLKATFLQTTVAGYSGCARAIQSLDFLRRLDRMTQPTLFVSGAKDTGAPTTVMEDMARAAPGAVHVDIPDCAHIANLNDAEAFNAALRAFLDA